MKLEKAIEILEKHGVVDEETTWGDYLKAVQLGIEAGKRLQQLRLSRITWFRGPLPGETND